ncbi:MAG: hypothetical protein ACKO0Z_25920 [Betaproteobacteria bacterium]
MLKDYLECGQLIVDRLKSRLASSFRMIAGESTLEQLANYGDYSPAALVIYGARAKGNSERRGAPVIIEQTWIVACMFPNYDAQGGQSGDNTRLEAGPALSKVIDVLHGWRPAAGFSALGYLGDERFADEGGQDVYALAFATSFSHCATREEGC